MRARARLPALVGTMLAVAAVATAVLRGSAAEILVNGGFETWSGAEPDGWGASVAVTRVGAPSVSGSAVRFDMTGDIAQVVMATTGGEYTAAAWAAAVAGSANVELRLTFLDAAFLQLGLPVRETAFIAASTFSQLSLATAGPANAAWVRFTLQVTMTGPASIVLDSAALDEVPPATPPPTEVPPPTATPTNTATPTRTPTRVPARVPTLAPPAGFEDDTPGWVRPTPTDERLLANGDFEAYTGDGPVFWGKFGGALSGTDQGRTGFGALLISDSDETKWLFQRVPVRAGERYRGTAWAKGTTLGAELFIRISWYPTPDASGELLDSVDSPVARTISWVMLDTGVVKAPRGALSARFRLMLRPLEASAALFDDAAFSVAHPDPVTAGGAAQPGQPPPTTRPVTTPVARDERLEPVTVPKPPRTGGPPELQLSEVVSDPTEAGNDGQFEWVELVNRSSAAVWTDGWRVGDAKATDAIPAMAVEPGGVVVVAGRGAVLPDGVRVVRVADGVIGEGLNNDGDTVRLIAPNGQVADVVRYSRNVSESGAESPAPGPGESIARAQDGGWARATSPSPGVAGETPGTTAAVTLAAPAGSREQSTPAGPWVVSGACAAAGIAGIALMARRRTRGRAAHA